MSLHHITLSETLQIAWLQFLRSEGARPTKVRPPETCEACPHVCFDCGEAELVRRDDGWLICPSCASAYRHGHLVKLEARRKERRDSAEIRACFAEDQRKGAPGGSDDGMATVPASWLEKGWDDGVLWEREHGTGRIRKRGRRVEQKTEVIQVRGIKATTDEALAACAELIEEAQQELEEQR